MTVKEILKLIADATSPGQMGAAAADDFMQEIIDDLKMRQDAIRLDGEEA